MKEPKIHKMRVQSNIENIKKDIDLKDLTRIWLRDAGKKGYTYNFSWMGRPIIQLPQDMIAMQEIIWNLKPDVIIETGIAHGGSLLFYASLLELIGHGQVIGVDIDIREHNRKEIKNHPMSKRITMFEGSSTDQTIVSKIKEKCKNQEKIVVLLDSNHTHDHVFEELMLYSQLVSVGSYLVVFDTLIEDMPDDYFLDRSWGKGNNPKTAVLQFLEEDTSFVIDENIENKILATVAPSGYLKKVR